jgi:thermitase
MQNIRTSSGSFSSFKASGRFVLAAVSVAAALACGSALAQGQAGTATTEAYAPGRILVMPRAGLPDTALARILNENGGGKARRIGKSELRIVDLPAGREKAMVERLARHPHFKFAELDYRVEPSLVPNDPYMGSAWHLTKIGASKAWDTSVGSGVTIAVLDSGIDAAHPDLKDRLVAGWNFYDNNSNTADVYGHGTLVAGSAAATINNGVGVASVSGQTKIMPIRVTDTSGAGWTSMIANGLIYAADRGVRVANISFANQPSRASVVSSAQYMKDKGGLVFVAAGNSGIDEGFAPTTSLIPVSATDQNDAKAGWSSYGNYVTLSAPGVSIYTTSLGGGYTASSGTSIATPVAAGVAALAFAARPALSSAQVESILLSTAVDLGSAGRDIYFGHGRVDAEKVVAAAIAFTATADTQAPSVAINAPLGSVTVSGLTPVNVSASDNVGVTRIDLMVNGTIVASDTAAPFGFSWNTAGVANGMASLVAVALDAAGNARSSTTVSVNVANNVVADTSAPVVRINNPVSGSKVSGNVSVTVAASDNGGSAGITQRLLINGRQVASATGGSLSYNWNTRKIAAGSYTVQAVAVDSAGNSGTTSVQVAK